MTNAELLSAHFPQLFHAAAGCQWHAIRTHGLLCNRRLVDLAGVGSETRASILGQVRTDPVVLPHPELREVRIRSQRPMRGMLRYVLSDMPEEEWLALLNDLCFLWPTKARLEAFLRAQENAAGETDVLVVDTASFLAEH